MAIGWLTVLKMVPWGDVIENAPKVAQGAKKLWHSVGKKTAPETMPDNATAASELAEPSSHDTALAALHAQVAALQQSTAELHQQMLESSALIQSLAEQNTQLIQRIELNRKRTVLLSVLMVVLAVLGFATAFKYF